VFGDGDGVLRTGFGTGLAFCFCLLNMAVTSALFNCILEVCKSTELRLWCIEEVSGDVTCLAVTMRVDLPQSHQLPFGHV